MVFITGVKRIVPNEVDIFFPLTFTVWSREQCISNSPPIFEGISTMYICFLKDMYLQLAFRDPLIVRTKIVLCFTFSNLSLIVAIANPSVLG